MRAASASLLVAAWVALVSFCGVQKAAADEPTHDDRQPEEPSTVVIVCPPKEPFGLRLAAEFEALGFRTVMVEPSGAPSRVSLEATARGARAIAAIQAVPGERGFEVWIADRVTGKTVLREIVSATSTPSSDASLALRVVELLRGSLLEASLPAPRPAEVAVTSEITTKLQVPEPAPLRDSARPRLGLSVAPGALVSPGGVPAEAALVTSAWWVPSDHFGFMAFASIPLAPARVDGAQGSIDLSFYLVGGGLRFQLNEGANRWCPWADAGFTAVYFTGAGTSSAGFASRNPTAATAAPFLRVGLGYALTRMLRLQADLLASDVVQGVSVRATNHEVAAWGRPLVLTTVGIGVGLN